MNSVKMFTARFCTSELSDKNKIIILCQFKIIYSHVYLQRYLLEYLFNRQSDNLDLVYFLKFTLMKILIAMNTGEKQNDEEPF